MLKEIQTGSPIEGVISYRTIALTSQELVEITSNSLKMT